MCGFVNFLNSAKFWLLFSVNFHLLCSLSLEHPDERILGVCTSSSLPSTLLCLLLLAFASAVAFPLFLLNSNLTVPGTIFVFDSELVQSIV